jgi:hypothetical protein
VFQRCSRCKHASYCGAECQNAAWQGHKKTCVTLIAQTCALAAPQDHVTAALQLIATTEQLSDTDLTEERVLAVVAAMRAWRCSVEVQEKGCWALRNLCMVARARENLCMVGATLRAHAGAALYKAIKVAAEGGASGVQEAAAAVAVAAVAAAAGERGHISLRVRGQACPAPNAPLSPAPRHPPFAQRQRAGVVSRSQRLSDLAVCGMRVDRTGTACST